MSEFIADISGAHERSANQAGNSVGEVLFGKFKISEIVQDGDSGTIYAARDLSNNTNVLIETINTQIPSGLDLFARLAKGVSELKHDNILRLIAYEEVKQRPYLVWEFVDFVRLIDLIEGGGFIEQESEIFDTISQICRGLQFAHENGIAHGYLHPRNICLADVDGEICIKIANFGFSLLQQQLHSYEGAGVIREPKPEADIYQLSVLTYFIVTGESPDPARSLDDILNPRFQDRVGFETLADQRPDLCGYEELAQLLDDTVDLDDNWRIKSPKEFEDGLADWKESVNSAVATKPAVAEKAVESEQQEPETKVKKKRKITNNMRTTVRQMVNLKSKQSSQEETAVMILTNIAAAKGPRQSPIASVARLSLGLLACIAIVGAALYATFVKPEECKQLFVDTSEQVVSMVRPSRPDAEETLPAEPVIPTPSPSSPSGPAAAQPPVATAFQKPVNKLPPFDHNVLHDLYSKDFKSNNNQTKRAFRIDYREFKEDWITK